MLDRQKEALLKSVQDVSEQVWDEEVEIAGVRAVRQTIAGTLDGRSVKIRQVVFVHRKVMFVIRVTLDRWATRDTVRSAESFADSLHFL